MQAKALTVFLAIGVMALVLSACGGETRSMSKPHGSAEDIRGVGQCKVCHLEHYDSWKMTLHSRMLQDEKKNWMP